MQEDRVITDKKYVHKFKDENVFLCNLRRALPLMIDKDCFENRVKNTVDAEEYWFLSCFYRLYAPARGNDFSGNQGAAYALCYLPAIHFIEPGVFEKKLQEKTNAWEKELLASLYSRETDRQGEYFKLKEDIAEPFDNFLVSTFKAWDVYINSEERTLLSEILEDVPGEAKREMYAANMFVNPEHEFFFEHPNEHVPGMMLIEAVRQFVIACGHKFGNVPFQDTQIILNRFECEFANYVNKNIPILLKGVALELKTGRQGYWQHLKISIELYQGARRQAKFFINGDCINSHLFERIRRNQVTELRRMRFLPLRSDDYQLVLHHVENGRRMTARLRNLSIEGMSLIIKREEYLPEMETMDLQLSYGQRMIIEGRYKKIWEQLGREHVIVGLKNIELNDTVRLNLHNLIANECIALERRDIN